MKETMTYIILGLSIVNITIISGVAIAINILF